MENFFEYLIAIFFIVSFLSSLLKPKGTGTVKTPDTAGKSRAQNQQQRRDTTQLKRPQTAAQKQGSSGTRTPATLSRNRDIDSAVKRDYGYYDENKVYNEERVNQPKESSVGQETNAAYGEYSAALKSLTLSKIGPPKIKENLRAKELKNKLKNPAVLRDLIVLSEIIGKPKALRR